MIKIIKLNFDAFIPAIWQELHFYWFEASHFFFVIECFIFKPVQENPV